jgi:hypothetical protein
MCICLSACIYSYKENKSVKIFIPLLILSIVVEAIRDLLFRKHNGMFLYHIYIPLEYAFISIYFTGFWNGSVKKNIIKWSSVIFLFFSIFISIKIIPVQKLPSIQSNVESILITILASFTLINIPIDEGKPIFYIPAFWICIGFILFYAGDFIINGTYNIIQKDNVKLAARLNETMNYIFNYLFYLLLTIGFLCSKAIRK